MHTFSYEVYSCVVLFHGSSNLMMVMTAFQKGSHWGQAGLCHVFYEAIIQKKKKACRQKSVTSGLQLGPAA
jgi:hypothetical protein